MLAPADAPGRLAFAMAVLDPHALLLEAYRAGIGAAQPERATRDAVLAIPDLTPDAWVLAIGKAAHGMASGAIAALRTRGTRLAGGVVIAASEDPGATHGLPVAIGDHPVPSVRSLEAAVRLSATTATVPAASEAIVLVSGGATSLVAAPIEGLTNDDLRAMFSSLLASGLPIATMNGIRRCVLRHGAGRLAVALAARRVHCLLVSDVIGDDPSSIASGPCTPAGTGVDRVRAEARAAGAWDQLPASVRQCLDDMAAGHRPGPPAADHPRFASTSVRVVLSRRDAERGAARHAESLGFLVDVGEVPVSGEAGHAGTGFAAALLSRPRSTASQCVIRSGEATVTLPMDAPPGGRCQELALAAAIALDRAGDAADGIALLAAGTDGRDGPTDAAGALVDATTCSRIRARGLDPVVALRRHASHAALDAAGALFRTGPTGTNVNDLVIGCIPSAT